MRTPSFAVPVLAAILLSASAARATAQAGPPPDDPGTKPIPRFAVDARVAFPRFKNDPAIAAGINVTPENLPTHGLGFVVGAHWYPVRLGVVTFGIGGELLRGRASRTLEPATETAEPGPTVKTRIAALSPQVSFNFGKRNGWSYISGGIGTSTFTAEREEAVLPDSESGSKTINYGGGARWFAREHLALSVDLRFYAINPRDASGGRPALPRMTLVMISAGASFK